MIWFLSGLLLIAASGIPGLLVRQQGNGTERCACALVLAGTLLCAWSLLVTVNDPSQALSWSWAVPAGRFVLQMDRLSAIFIAPLLLIVGAGSVYGLGYWPQQQNPGSGRKLRFFYGLISAAMLLLLTARNSVLFLLAWEIMALSGYFLITTQDRHEEVRRSGYVYLVATHCGTLALFGLFITLELASGSMLFPAAASLPAAGSALIFLLGLFGFGMKAGLMPLHVWLPGAHAAAPSHASALLSGAMIKTGIYGLVRLTSFFAEIPPWWGWTVLLMGVVSGILGVALAIAQHDIKRLLAYHSVENIGIIAIGLGLALLGRSYGQPTLVVLGLSGCLLHVANHGLFKALLFLSAGSVIHAVGSREIDHFGGLLKRQRWTGLFFLGGAVAISGLPPFNGFISEWLIYLAAFDSVGRPGSALMLSLLAAPALALIGGLALACFVKVFGVSFLGEPRTPMAGAAHEAPRVMLWPMALLLFTCIWIGLMPTSLRPLLEQAASDWTGSAVLPPLVGELAPLGAISLAGWLLIALLLLVGGWLWRRSASVPRDQGTWGCGYSFPHPGMQYTASSFADGLVRAFRFGLWSERHGGRVVGLFPGKAQFSSHTPDLVLERTLNPAFSRMAGLFLRLRRLIQNGVAAFYLLYIALTLVVLLALLSR
jgi:hydrogenase-4 component B